MEIIIIILLTMILVVSVFISLFLVGLISKLIEIEKTNIYSATLIKKLSTDQLLLIQTTNLLSTLVNELTESLFELSQSLFDSSLKFHRMSPDDEEIVDLLHQNEAELTNDDIIQLKNMFNDDDEDEESGDDLI